MKAIEILRRLFPGKKPSSHASQQDGLKLNPDGFEAWIAAYRQRLEQIYERANPSPPRHTER